MRSEHQAVVVGAGQAGFQVAASLRDSGWEGRILLLDGSGDLPYNRPPLSKEYLHAGDDDIALRPPSFYRKLGIELRLDSPVAEIDRAGAFVRTGSGQRIPYDELILATGASPRVPELPGTGLDGVVTLRDRGDADGIRSRLATAERVVIAGGGFIGVEVAAAASHRCDVTLVERGSRLLRRSVSEAIAGHVEERHRHNGVNLVLSDEVVSVAGHRGRVSGVLLSTGRRLDADLVLFAVGVVPRTALARAAGLEVDDGISVDATLRTGDPRISAIGDCARFPLAQSAVAVRLESVQNAVEQARHVAARLTTGSTAPYSAVPWFWTHQYQDSIQIAGIGATDDEWMLGRDATSEKFSVYRFRGDVLTAVESVNSPRDHMLARRRLAAASTRADLAEVLDPVSGAPRA